MLQLSQNCTTIRQGALDCEAKTLRKEHHANGLDLLAPYGTADEKATIRMAANINT